LSAVLGLDFGAVLTGRIASVLTAGVEFEGHPA